ncbi:MAG: hypothetical protein M3Q82_00890 [Actinomycetota bacterium]|nr:hypothetical protein [Actinomycetota bacterium]
MFDEIDGLPLHPLVVHAAVVLVPLAALLGVLFAVPRTRAWARLPLLLVAVAAAASTFVAKLSGENLKEALQLGGRAAELIEEHEARGNLLLILVLVFAVFAVVGFVVTRTSTANSPVVIAIAAALVIGAMAVGVQVYRVGDIGSRAVWNPTGDTDFSS